MEDLLASFSEWCGSLGSKCFTWLSVKANGLQGSLTFLLPPMLFRLLESWAIEPALPQEGQSRRCFVFLALTLRVLGVLPLTTSFPYPDLRLFNMRSGTQEPCLWGGVSTREWGLAQAPDLRGSSWRLRFLPVMDLIPKCFRNTWWLEGKKT